MISYAEKAIFIHCNHTKIRRMKHANYYRRAGDCYSVNEKAIDYLWMYQKTILLLCGKYNLRHIDNFVKSIKKSRKSYRHHQWIKALIDPSVPCRYNIDNVNWFLL